jgi:predicted amidohydrolase
VSVRVTSIQLAIAERSKERALAIVLERLEQTRGSDLVLLPEIWATGYFSFPRYEAEAEAIDGPTMTALRTKAADLRCHLFAGSFVERDQGKLYNTSVLLDSRGEILARYRKIHLFGYGSEESRLLTRGDEVVVADCPWGKTGLSTCYDLRFPELYRKMVERGAVMFLVASAWPEARLDAWRLFNRARAHENLAFVISCNCAGTDSGRRYAGRSAVIDPLGRVVAEAGDDEQLLAAEIDPRLVETVRGEFPALRDRVLL